MNATNPYLKASKEASSFFSPAHDPIRPDELHGRQRVAYFTHDQTAMTASDTMTLTKLPKGARVLGGRINHADMGAARTVSIGISGVDNSGEIAKDVNDDPDFFAEDLDIAAAGNKDIANTLALNTGYRTEKEVYLFATLSAHTWPADKAFQGYVTYVVD